VLDISELKIATIVEEPKWPEPVVVMKIENVDDDILLIVTTTHTNKYFETIQANEELENINLKTISCDFSSNCGKSFWYWRQTATGSRPSTTRCLP